MALKQNLQVNFTGNTGSLDKALGGLQGKFAKFAKVGVAIGGAAVAGFAAKGIKDFVAFEQQMNEVFTLLPGISRGAMDKMTGQVKDFSKKFGVLPQKTVPALYQALSAGVPAGNVFEFLETAQKAAKGGVTELETAVDGISSVVNAYGVDVISAAKASDLMFTAVKLGKTNFEQLSSSLFNVAPAAASVGVKFEEVTAAIAALTSQGVPTTVATTQIRQAIVELTQGSAKAAKTFKDLSGKSFPDFIKGGGTLQQALQLMEKAAKKNGVSLLDMFGSVEAGQAALSLTGKGTEKFNAALEGMGQSAGASDEAFKRMESGIGAALDKVKAFVAVVALDVGQKLTDLAKRVIPVVRAGFDVIRAWWQENGPAIIARVQEIFGAIRSWIEDVVPAIQDWVRNVLGELADWWRTWGPRIVALVKGLAQAFETLVRATVRTVQFIVRNWDKIRPVFLGVAALITAVLIPHFAALGAAAILSAAKQKIAWVATKVEAVKAAVVHSAQVVKMVARWVALGAAAVASGAQTVAIWALYKAEAIKAAAVHAAQVAKMVARWVFLGVQSLLHAGKVAAAWLIAMGPIGLVIAAVAGAAALIVVHWGTIKKAFSAAAEFIKRIIGAAVGWIKRNWDLLVPIFFGPIGIIVILIRRFGDDMMRIIRGAIGTVVRFFTELPGRILAAIGGLGRLLVQHGKDLVFGFLRGINDQAERLWRALRGFPGRILRFFRDAGKWLVNAGKDMLGGFISGASSVAGKLTFGLLGGGPAPGEGALPGGSVIGKLSGFMRSTGIPHRVTSTLRPGDKGFHGLGRAVDFAGPSPGRNTPQLRAIQRAWLPLAGGLKELIGPNPGLNFKNGRPFPYSSATQRAHQNHVHVAMAEGGIVKRPTMALIGEAGPEAVIPLNRGMGGVTVNVTVGTLVGAGGMDELANVIRRKLLATKSRNVTSGL